MKNLPAPSPPGFLRIPAFLKAAQAGAEVGLPRAKEKAKAAEGPGLHTGVTTRWLLHFPQGRRQGEAQSGGRAVPAVGWGEALGQGPAAQRDTEDTCPGVAEGGKVLCWGAKAPSSGGASSSYIRRQNK